MVLIRFPPLQHWRQSSSSSNSAATMDTMKQLSLNTHGVGDMVVLHAPKPGAASSSPIDMAITSGEDGMVYLVDLHSEQSFFDAVVCDGTMPALAVTPDNSHLLVVSGDENALYSYKLAPQFEREALLLRSPVAIRHVAATRDLIAVATEDTEIKVLRRAATDEIISIAGHDHGIKSVAFDGPDGHLLCTASEDGTVRVFDVDAVALSANQVAVFKIKYADLRSEEVLCRCAWQPAGELLAVPVNQGIVELYSKSDWTSRGSLTLPIGKSKAADVNVLSFSPNGQYLAGGSLKQEVFVWSMATKQVIRSFKVEHNVTAVQWAPTQNALLVFNDGGKLGIVKDTVPMGLTPPHHIALGGETKTKPSSQTKSIPASKAKKPINASQFVEDEAVDDGNVDDDDDEEEEAEITGVEAIKASFGFGTAASSTEADLGLINDDVDNDADDLTTSKSYGAISASPFETFQEPFQSGAVTDGAVSLLAWTPLGEIECIRGANRSEHLVKVEFADKSRRGFKFTDNYLFSMATLDDHGAFFAVPRRARQDWDMDTMNDHESGDIIRSFVFYRPFESWASNAAWHLDLPDGEDAECVACAAEFCAVATSLHCLRVFTTSGIAYATLRLPGRVVTLAARGTQLAVVYQEGYAKLGYQLLDIKVSPSAQRVQVLTTGSLPLSPPLVDVFASHKENEQLRKEVANWSRLAWLGFDDRGVLYSVDSFGCVQALANSYGWQWFPIGCVGNNLLKKPEDRTSIFTLGVVNNSLMYFPLESGQSGPRLRGKHRPVPLKFNLHHAAFPKTQHNAVKAKGSQQPQGPVVNDLWQQVRLAALANDYETEDKRVVEQAEMDKSLILMMKAACTNDEPARVLDLAKCLHLEKSHQIAQKLAVHFGFRTLQTQLYDLYRDRFETQHVSDSYSQPVSSSSHYAAASQSAEPPLAAPRPQPRLGRVPKPAPEPSQPSQTQETEAAESQLSSRYDDASMRTPEKEKPRSVVNVERSVAPINPFLKKPKDSIAVASDDSEPKSAAGLERLAKFTSPPPAKRLKPSWK